MTLGRPQVSYRPEVNLINIQVDINLELTLGHVRLWVNLGQLYVAFKYEVNLRLT